MGNLEFSVGPDSILQFIRPEVDLFVFDFSENPVIAHRGASAYAPENTLSAFDMALAYGAQWVEFDVILSKDNELFVFHDETLTRTSNGQGKIGEVSAEYLATLDAGSWFSKRFAGERIPHVRDVLKWLAFSTTQANIEIKPYLNQAEQTAIALLSQLHRYWPAEQPLPLVSSFNKDALFFCRNLAPELPLGLLLHEWDEGWQQQAAALGCVSVHLNQRVLTPERVRAVKDAGYLLLSYTVNKARLAKKLLSWGVDAVFSDYPDLLR